VSDAHIGAYGDLITTRLRVLTWNIWWQFGPWEARQPAIAGTLAAVDADVVCLQECWPEQVEGLGRELGYQVAYASRIDLNGVPFGNAVLSRWPITSSEWRPLPSPPDLDEQRTVLRADIEGPRGALQVFSTHLHWRFDHSAIRVEQVRAICRFVDESRPAGGRTFPPIVGGDFNADADSDEIRLLNGRSAPPVPKLVFHDAWEAAGGDREAGWTWSNDNPFARLDLEPNRRIDYVFVGWPKEGGAGHVVACDVVGADPVDGMVGSDHHGVLAQLRD
jgi:endonuclease/exonuclease/phosphatase family metal-dependent hydrolase